MTKLYHVVAHNLNEARKARDGNKKSTKRKEPVTLCVGDNVLVSISGISAKIQRFLHNRTARKESGRNQRQPWSHNQSTP